MNPDHQATGHFDRWSVLEPMLVNYEPPRPEVVLLETYRSWSAAERERFDQRRMDRIANSIVVETPKLLELITDLRRAALFAGRSVGRTGAFLTGAPTVGKTTASVYAMRDAFRRHVIRFPDWKERGHVPVAYVEIPPGCTGRSFMGRVLDFYGYPYVARSTLEERTKIATSLMTRARTSLLVVDETQNLNRLTNGNFESAQAIKGLVNAVSAVPLLVGIDLDKTMLSSSLGSQFAARATLVQLTKIGHSTTDDKRLWAGVIQAFERQLGLFAHPLHHLDSQAGFLWRRTQGSLGALSRIFATTALELIAAGEPEKETITPELISSVKVDLATQRDQDASVASSKGRNSRGKVA